MSTVYSFEKLVKLILVYLLLMINPRLLYSQEARWVEAEASASMADKSLQQARTSALNEARAEAVRIVAGVRIQAENFRIRTEIEVDKQVNEVRDFFSSMIRDVAFGQIIAEEIITEGPIPISVIPGKPPEFYYKVKIRAKVAIEKGEPDPSFTISVKTNKDIYQENEEMTIDIRASQDCYVHVFNILANDSLLVLYPNRYMRYDRLPANSILHLMPAGFSLQVCLLPGLQKDVEFIYVVATKEHIDFTPGEENDNNAFQTMTTKSFVALELPKWLSHIRPDKRTDGFVAYQVFRSRSRR